MRWVWGSRCPVEGIEGPLWWCLVLEVPRPPSLVEEIVFESGTCLGWAAPMGV